LQYSIEFFDVTILSAAVAIKKKSNIFVNEGLAFRRSSRDRGLRWDRSKNDNFQV